MHWIASTLCKVCIHSWHALVVLDFFIDLMFIQWESPRKNSTIFHWLWSQNAGNGILGDPGASSRNNAIFPGESLLQELNSPWELTEPVSEEVELRPALIGQKKYFSAQSARSSSQVTLSPSYAKYFSSSIDQVGWPVQREDCRGEFQKKMFTAAEEIAALDMGARNQYSSIDFLGGLFIEGIS